MKKYGWVTCTDSLVSEWQELVDRVDPVLKTEIVLQFLKVRP